MKLTAILLLAICMQVNATGYGQGISLSEKNISLQKVFKQIEKQSGYEFLYPQTLLEQAGTITIEVRNASLQQVLEQCLKDKKLTYTIVEKTVIIRKQEEQLPKENLLPPPRIDIKGRITNEKGEPVLVSVVVKGTNTGTTTNSEGYFELRGVEQNAVLVISGVSVETEEVSVNGRTTFTISIKTKIAEAEEVMIRAGYYDVRKREATGNISKVKAEEIEKQPVGNALATLMTRVPGLEIQQQSGVSGGNFKVRIRGTNSIANGNDPLYIIDGVPFVSATMANPATSGTIYGYGTSPLNAINPADVESIEVLKDADATAIYGSRGANGVILITTKRGKAGATRTDFNFYTGTAKVPRTMDLLNREQYLEMRREAFANSNATPTTSNGFDLLTWDTTRSTDWQKTLIGGTANTMDAQLSFSGGDNNTQFLAGAGYHRETTVFPGDNSDQRASVHAGINNTSVNQKLKIAVSINYSVNMTDMLRQDLTQTALTLAPNAPALYDADGNLSWTGWTPGYENPVAYTKRRYESITYNLIGNSVIAYAIRPNLEIKSSFGYTTVTNSATNLRPISTQYPDVGNVNASLFWDRSFRNWVIEPQLSWRPRLGDGQFEVLVGSTFLGQTEKGLGQGGYGFSSEELMKNLSSASNIVSGTNLYTQYRYNAIFGRINYNLDKKYIINITGRRDGSSRFGPGKQFANFGAIGTAWIFSKENFIQRSLPFLSFGKIRASYGTSGNDQLGDYQYLDTYSSSSSPYLGSIGLGPDRLSNPDFAWEINKKLEATLELGFIRDRILLGVSYYRNRSSNQLVGFPLVATTGFSSIQGNFPASVQNTGVEIELSTRIIDTRDFTWLTSLNLSIPKNKLLAFPNMENFPAYADIYVVGEPLSIRKLYNYTGIDPVNGTYNFEDVNSDGTLDYRDRTIIKFSGRKFYGGLNSSIEYKNFQIDLSFQFIKQETENYKFYFNVPGIINNEPVYVLSRWQKQGDNATAQKFGVSGPVYDPYERYSYSQASHGDASSFIRLKNAAVSYSFPQTWVKRLHIQQARLFMQGQNLLTITKYEGLDPEQPGGALPPLRVLTGGVRLTF